MVPRFSCPMDFTITVLKWAPRQDEKTGQDKKEKKRDNHCTGNWYMAHFFTGKRDTATPCWTPSSLSWMLRIEILFLIVRV